MSIWTGGMIEVTKNWFSVLLDTSHCDSNLLGVFQLYWQKFTMFCFILHLFQSLSYRDKVIIISDYYLWIALAMNSSHRNQHNVTSSTININILYHSILYTPWMNLKCMSNSITSKSSFTVTFSMASCLINNFIMTPCEDFDRTRGGLDFCRPLLQLHHKDCIHNPDPGTATLQPFPQFSQMRSQPIYLLQLCAVISTQLHQQLCV